jgi:Bacterial SH3 domain
MRRLLSILLLLVFAVISTVATGDASSGHYGSGYGGHHYSGSFSHHHPYYRSHSYHSDRIWAGLGIGLLTGAVIGSVLYQVPEERTIVYNTAPPVIVYPDPVVVAQPYPPTPPQAELILRRVKTTAGVLNIRSTPGLEAPIAGQVQQNTILDVLGAAPDWLYIRTETGQYGWVLARYTRQVEEPVG